MAAHNELGTKGEDAATAFLQQNGHTILTRNYRYGKCEVDIIATHQGLTIFVEVKTRSTDYFGFPEESVDKKKRQNMRKATEEYMYQNKLDTGIRFDIVSITNENGVLKIYHIKDAFFSEGDGGAIYDL